MFEEDSDLLIFKEEEEGTEYPSEAPWKVMIVDDEEDVHEMTKMTLDSITFENKGLQFVSAFSGGEAKRLLSENSDIALILLDVVMETDDAGLRVVKFIRQDQENHMVRIILRTGQPGVAPENKVVVDYDINDYKEKAELTSQKMFTSVISSLRSYRNITELVEQDRAEQEMKKAKEIAEEKAKLKDLFVSIVAHDLRNPLSTIKGFVELVVGDKAHPVSEKHSQCLTRTLNVTTNLIEMTKRLLSVGIMSSGKMELHKELFDGNETVAMLVERLEPSAEGKGVELINSVSKTKIFADRELFNQVIHNLVSNAMKFSNPNGKILIFTVEGEPTCIAVKDEGTGIGEKILPDIFKHEIKTTRLGTAGERGTGLGLPYCKDIMEAHGGTLTIETTPEKGSIFYARLPEGEKITDH